MINLSTVSVMHVTSFLLSVASHRSSRKDERASALERCATGVKVRAMEKTSRDSPINETTREKHDAFLFVRLWSRFIVEFDKNTIQSGRE